MSIMDSGQPRPDYNDSNKDDSKSSADRIERERAYRKAHYEKNKAYYIAKAKESKAKRRVEWVEFKSSLSCTKCGENHFATLDFHHVVRSPENEKVHRLAGNGRYRKAMQEIRDKCIVLCANCHRKLHWEEDQVKKTPRV